MCTKNVTYVGKGERNGVQRRTKVRLGRTVIQALEMLWLVKGMSQDEPVVIAIIELCLSEGISKGGESVCQSVENSTK